MNMRKLYFKLSYPYGFGSDSVADLILETNGNERRILAEFRDGERLYTLKQSSLAPFSFREMVRLSEDLLNFEMISEKEALIRLI